MKALALNLPIFIFAMLFSSINVLSEEVNKEDLEKLLVTQLHTQISEVIKEFYKVEIAQYENPRITAINTDVIPEPSEEMKPGFTYEVILKVDVLSGSEKKETLILTLNNDHSSGKLLVKKVRKAK